MRQLLFLAICQTISFSILISCNNSNSPKATENLQTKETTVDTPQYFLLRHKLEKEYGYSHAVKILQEMEKSNLVSFEKQGRIKTIQLTDTGNRVAEHIEKIKTLL